MRAIHRAAVAFGVAVCAAVSTVGMCIHTGVELQRRGYSYELYGLPKPTPSQLQQLAAASDFWGIATLLTLLAVIAVAGIWGALAFRGWWARRRERVAGRGFEVIR